MFLLNNIKLNTNMFKRLYFCSIIVDSVWSKRYITFTIMFLYLFYHFLGLYTLSKNYFIDNFSYLVIILKVNVARDWNFQKISKPLTNLKFVFKRMYLF